MYLQQLLSSDLSVCRLADNFLQSSFWGDFKSKFAWKTLSFNATWSTNSDENPQNQTLPLLVLWRPLVAGFGFAYIPWGPILPASIAACDKSANTALKEIAVALRCPQYAAGRREKPFLPANTAFLRLDPPWFCKDGDARRKINAPFIHSYSDIQAPDTVLIDLTPNTDEILSLMKSKCRYNVRLGGKKVKVRQAYKQDLPVFYQIFQETSKRDGIAIHRIGYYASLFDLSCEEFDVRLYLASCKDGDSTEEITIAGIITLFFNGTATYLYGASSNRYRNLMAPYALQWRAICDAKENGCKIYDLFGIPPSDDPQHPMAGLYRFKTGFAGKIIHRSGSWDYPYNIIFTCLFQIAERLRKKFRDLKKKQSRF